MNRNHKAVFGIYRSREDVDIAIEVLKANHFRTTDISVLIPNPSGSAEMVHKKSTKAPEGAVTGAGTGAVIGGALGLLAGIGALSIPGIGPFLAAGPILSALAGIGIGGAVGGVSGALIGMGVPEYEAQRYEGYVKEGGLLLSVHTEDGEWLAKAKYVLETTGAHDIASSKEIHADWNSPNDTRNKPADFDRFQPPPETSVRNKNLNDINDQDSTFEMF